MKFSTLFLFIFFVLMNVLSVISNSQAQVTNYQELVVREQQQPLFFNFIVLPNQADSSITFSSVFSLTYDYLSFKKPNTPAHKEGFTSTVSLNMEVFNSTEAALEKKHLSIENLEPAERAFWSDTAFAKSYEQTQSSKQFLSGHLDVSLEPGVYSYVIQMNKLDGTEDQISRAQSVRAEPFSKIKVGDVLLGNQLIKDREIPQFKLISLGNNVIFGNDFYALAYIPDFEESKNYTLQIHNLNSSKGTKPAYSQKLTKDDILVNILPQFSNEATEGNFISLPSAEEGYAFALVKIPGSTFPNNRYRLTISESKTNQVTSQAVFQTLWIDMPTSLLSLDVSIEMLRFIVDDETLERLSQGSREEREKRFRAFWKERDPTPQTAFNELMAEYYRRIDYAYENFSSQTLPGYKSDQGKIYIKFGAPQNIERKYPPEGATREIWQYPNRRFIFKATSGFGDFKLVSD